RRRNTGRCLRRMPGIQRFSPKRQRIQGANAYVSKKASPTSSHQYYKRESHYHGSGRGVLVSKYYVGCLRVFLGITFAFVIRCSFSAFSLSWASMIGAISSATFFL